MRVTNLVSKSHQAAASVFLAFSLFGFLFPHHAARVQQNHQVNWKGFEQAWHTKTDGSEPQYKNPRASNPGTPYNQGW